MIEHCKVYDQDIIIPFCYVLYFGRPLVLVICVLISILTWVSILTAVSILTGLSQGGTDSGLLPDSGLHPNIAFLIVVNNTVHISIFISAYPAVRVKIYAYVNMLGRNGLALINSLFARKESNRCKPKTMRREETTTGTTRMTA